MGLDNGPGKPGIAASIYLDIPDSGSQVNFSFTVKNMVTPIFTPNVDFKCSDSFGSPELTSSAVFPTVATMPGCKFNS